MWNFKGILWYFKQNTLPIHWKVCFFIHRENLRALICKSSFAVLKRSLGAIAATLKRRERHIVYTLDNRASLSILEVSFTIVKLYIHPHCLRCSTLLTRWDFSKYNYKEVLWDLYMEFVPRFTSFFLVLILIISYTISDWRHIFSPINIGILR